MKNNYVKFVISIILPLLAGGIGSYFTTSKIPTWYAGLEKATLNPPSWVFGPVWTTLYILMGIALFLVWKRGVSNPFVKRGLVIFAVQLILNTAWSIAFFGLENPFAAFVIIIAMWLSILWNILAFCKVSKTAGWLLVPYLAWVSFASYLNYMVWVLNK